MCSYIIVLMARAAILNALTWNHISSSENGMRLSLISKGVESDFTNHFFTCCSIIETTADSLVEWQSRIVLTLKVNSLKLIANFIFYVFARVLIMKFSANYTSLDKLWRSQSVPIHLHFTNPHSTKQWANFDSKTRCLFVVVLGVNQQLWKFKRQYLD